MDINSLTKQEIEDLAERLSEVRGKVQVASSSASSAINDLSTAQFASANRLYEVGQGISQTAQGLIQFTRATVDGNTKLNKYGKGVEAAFSGIGSIFAAFGPFGAIVGAITQGLGKLAGDSLERTQTYLDASDTLTEFAGASAQTAEQLMATVSGLEFGSATLDKLIKPVTGLGVDIMALGKNAGAAQTKFIELTNVGTSVREQYLNLGISQEQLIEMQASFVKIQARTTGIRAKDDNELRSQTTKYVDKLMVLSALTGQSTDQLRHMQEKNAQDFRLSLAMQNETTEVAERMRGAVDHFTGIVLDDKLGAGVREAFSGSMLHITEGGRALRTIVGESIFGYVDAVKRGTMSEQEFTQVILNSYRQFLSKNIDNVKLSEEFANQFGISAELFASLNKQLIAGTPEEVKAEMERRKLEADGIRSAQAAKIRAEKGIQKAYEALVSVIAGPVSAAFKGIMYGLQLLAEGFVKTLARLGFIPAEMELAFESKTSLEKKQAEIVTKIQELTADMSRRTDLDNLMLDATGAPTGISLREEETKKLDALKDRLKMVEKLVTIKASGEFSEESVQPAATPPVATDDRTDAVAPAAISSTTQPVVDPSSVKRAPNAVSSAPVVTPTKTFKVGSTSTELMNEREPGFKKGGIAKGPTSGYKKTMHGLEAVVPLPDGKTIPVTLNIPQLTEKNQNPLLDSVNISSIFERYAKALVQTVTKTNNVNITPQANEKFEFTDAISTRFDTLIASMKQNTDLQSELLYYVKR